MIKKRAENAGFFLSGIFLGMIFFGAGLRAHGQSQQGSNDHIFPAAAVAKRFIDFDARGFLVNGRREFLVSAGIEYARVPHELWQDRLLRLQRAGFNCVEIYTFWNYHEPQEGKFDFSGDKDLNGFLALVKKMGMYAIVRVGPYYCAEWDNGGYPLWLRFKEGVRVREDNAAFEKYVDRFFDRLLPVVMRNQIHHGGPVILVQLENEHIEGWGTAMPNGYFRHLRDKALSLGLEVPYFFSGLHHSSDPAGNLPGDPVNPTAGIVVRGSDTGSGTTTGAADSAAAVAPAIGIPVAGTPESRPRRRRGNKTGGDPMALDDSTRPNPWFSTEFWSVWFSGYSSGEKEALDWGRRTWKIIAHGGGGYNYYMAHGGSNFGYTNNDEDEASYDYGAAVGQAGDLRPIYYEFKRAAYFARSFREILANSEDSTSSYRFSSMHESGIDSGSEQSRHFADSSGNIFVTDSHIRSTARHSSVGDLLFLDNYSGVEGNVKLAMNDTQVKGNRDTSTISLILAPGEIVPLVRNFPLEPGVILEQSASRILGIARQNETTTIVIFGEPGSQGLMRFSMKGIVRVTEGLAQGASDDESRFFVKPGTVDLVVKFSSTHKPAVYSFSDGNQRIRILAMSRELADRTWFVPKKYGTLVVCGPSFAGDTMSHALTIEQSETDTSYFPVWVYDGGKSYKFQNQKNINKATDEKLRVSILTLSPWKVRSATDPASNYYDDSKWLHSELPLQMGADGDLSPDAWYRTTIRVPDAGLYTLQVEGSDRATVFVDGVKTGTGNIRSGELSFPLQAGSHQLSIFVAHDGRDKLAAYMGRIDSSDRKGLFGEAVLKKGGPSIRTVSGWHFRKAASAEDVKQFPSAGVSEAGWKPYSIGDDAFGLKQGYGWFRAELDSLPAGVQKIALNFRSVDEDATVFVNGHLIGSHRGWNSPFRLLAGSIDTIHGPVELTVFIENHSNEGGIDQPVRFNSVGDGIPVTGWTMRGGAGELGAIGVSRMIAIARMTGERGMIGEHVDAKTGNPDRSVAVGEGPRFLSAHFQVPAFGADRKPYGSTGRHPIWRVHTDGLGHGSVWVNGHNLGRYPEKTPAPGLYIPECWLKAGDNELVIYEEDGNGPEKVSVRVEETASRNVEMLTGLK